MKRVLGYLVLIWVGLWHVTQSYATVEKAAGILLYTPCPDKADSYCAILGMRKFGNQAGSFSNPGGFIDEGESFEAGAIREIMEETGYAFNFQPSDLGKDFETLSKIDFIEHTSNSDHKGLGDKQVLYRLYFKQVSPITAQQLMERAKEGRKLKGGGEVPAFALVPIAKLYDAVIRNKPIVMDATNPKLFAADESEKSFQITPSNKYEIKLFDPFKALLNQHEATRKQAGKLSWLGWLKGKPSEQDLRRKEILTQAIQQSSPQNTRLGVKGGTGEDYAIEEKEWIHRNRQAQSPKNLPFTASEAQLRLLTGALKKDPTYLDPQAQPFDAVFQDFYKQHLLNGLGLDPDDISHDVFKQVQGLGPKTQKQFQAVLEKEAEHKDKYVLYHAMNHINAFAQDVLTELRRQLSQNPKAVNLGGIWDSGFFNQELFTLQHLFEGEQSKVFSYDQYKHSMLSTNPGLFFNYTHKLEFTPNYWLSDLSHTTTGGIDALGSALSALGISDPTTLIQQLLDVPEDLRPQNGRLLQIFLDPAVIDQVAYVADGNRPLHKAIKGASKDLSLPSNTLYHLRENPDVFEVKIMGNANMTDGTGNTSLPKTNRIQVRFLPFSDIVSKTQNMQVFTYDDEDKRTAEQKKTYQERLKTFVASALIPAFQKGLQGFRFKGDSTQPPAMQEFEKNNPGRVKRMPGMKQLKTWVEQDNEQALIEFAKAYPQISLGSVVEESTSAFGTSKRTLLEALIAKKKWALLKTLSDAIPPGQDFTKIEIVKAQDVIHKIEDTELFKSMLLSFKKHNLNPEFYEDISFLTLNGSLQSHMLDQSTRRGQQEALERLSWIFDQRLVTPSALKKNIIGLSSASFLPALNFFIEQKGMGVGFRELKLFFTNENHFPTEKHAPIKETPKWHQALQTFLNHCFDQIQKKKIDLAEGTGKPSWDIDNITPETLKMLYAFKEKLQKANLAPNLVAYIEEYFPKPSGT